MAKLSITSHAVDQYQRRVNPSWEWEFCRQHLVREASHAHKLEDPTATGEERWEITDAILVVARGRGEGEKNRRIVRTALAKPKVEPALPDWLEAEIAAAIGGGDGR